MSSKTNRIVVPFAMFCAGVAVATIGNSFAAVTAEQLPDFTGASYIVSIDEVKQNFAFGEPMRDAFIKTVKMSDGSERTVELRPVLRNGETVIEFKDGSGMTYMGIGGTTTNGKLMVSVHEIPKAP